MTKTKKALMGLTALLMAFSMAALTACSKGGNNGDEGGKGDGDKTEQGTGDKTDGDKTEGDKTDGDKTEGKTDIDKILEATAKQTVAGITAIYSTEISGKENRYNSDADGVILPDEESTVLLKKNNSEWKFVVDLNSLDIDSHMVREEESALESDPDTKYTSVRGYYTFKRGESEFNYYADKKVTDFSGLTLSLNDDNESEEGPDASAILGMMMSADGTLSIPFNTVINLGKTYSASTFADKKLTINLNTVAYKAYNEVMAVIEGLTETSVVGTVVESAPVKNLIDALTFGFTAKDIYDMAKENSASKPATQDEGAGESSGPDMAAMIASMFELLPEPEAGASVHSYLVSALKSQELSQAVLSMVPGLPEEAISQIGTLYNFTVIDLIKLVMAMMPGDSEGGNTDQEPVQSYSALVYEGEAPELTMESIKSMVKGMIGEMLAVTEDKVTISMDGDVSEMSGLKLALTVNDNYEIVSAEAAGNIASDTGYISEYEEGKYYTEKSKMTGSFKATMELHASAPALTDISNNYVEEEVDSITEGGVYYSILSFEQEDKSYDVVLRITVGELLDSDEYYSDYAVSKVELLDKVGGSVKETFTDLTEAVYNFDDGASLSDFATTVSVYTDEDYQFVNGYSVSMTYVGGGLETSGSSLVNIKKVSDYLKK